MSCSSNFLKDLPPLKKPMPEEPSMPENNSIEAARKIIADLQSALSGKELAGKVKDKLSFQDLWDNRICHMWARPGGPLESGYHKQIMDKAIKIVQEILATENLPQETLIVKIKELQNLQDIRQTVSELLRLCGQSGFINTTGDKPKKSRRKGKRNSTEEVRVQDKFVNAFKICLTQVQKLLDLDIEPTETPPQS
jgi:hypothetical protein